MDELVVFELTCSYCGDKFVVCRPDYRGQSYCKDVCRKLEQPARRRLTNAKHQRSEEGRHDHAERQRALVTPSRDSWCCASAVCASSSAVVLTLIASSS